MKRSNNAQILVKYRLHCLWAGQCELEIEVERVAGWIFPTGSLPENPDPARFTASDRSSPADDRQRGVNDAEVGTPDGRLSIAAEERPDRT